MRTHSSLVALADLDETQPELIAALRSGIDAKTKPLGALGRLEDLAVRIGTVLGQQRPELVDPQVVVCAGDHGVAVHGVSAYPPEVTAQMVATFLSGGAAVSVLAAQHGLSLTVVDCGVRGELPPHPRLLERSLGPGTADALSGPAMTPLQCARAVAAGRELIRGLPGNVVLLGEMGIGNTSSAALLAACLLGLPVEALVGRVTGVDDAGLAHKTTVLRQVQAVHADATEPSDVLARVGGFEIATLVGATIEAAAQRRVVVLDGFIGTVAALVAERIAPRVVQRCIAAHVSTEPGHTIVLQALGLTPLLRLDLRLGEGSGAALAWPLLESACRVLRDMATFEQAGVSGADG